MSEQSDSDSDPWWDDDGGRDSIDVFAELRKEISDALDEYEETRDEIYDAPECPYCGRETEIGALGGGEVKFGCYRDDCDIKEEQGQFSYYHTSRSLAPSTAAAQKVDALINFCHRLAVENRSVDTERDRS